MKKKILVFTNVFPDSVEGDKGLHMKIECVGLAKEFDVEVIAPIPWLIFLRRYLGKKRNRQMRHPQVTQDIPVYRPVYFTIPRIGLQFSGVFYFLSVLGLVLILRRNCKFDLILAYWTYPDGYVAALFSKMFKVPLIIRPRGSDINIIAQNKKLRPYVIAALEKADKVITVSAALKEKVKELGIDENKISVITLGINQDRFFMIGRQEARERLGLPQEQRIILFVGNLVPIKGIDVFLKAMHILKSRGTSNCMLCLVGSGPLKENLCNLITDLSLQDCVRMVGGVSNQNLRLWMNASDLFCLPSHNEGWPNVLMEALACGIPVVATNVGGIPEIINDKKLGVLIPPKNPEMFAQGIKEALNKEWDRDILVGRVRNSDWGKIVQQVSSECGELIRRYKSGGINEG